MFDLKLLNELLNELEVQAYLVGGWVRDRLIDQSPNQNTLSKKYLDLDFVLPRHSVQTAKAIANKYNAGFVVLDSVRQIARVVFADGTADFAQQLGDSIEADLSHRDFTMNAIAIDCAKITTTFLSREDLPELIDPFMGQRDIQNQRIQMINPQNLQDDPLRILRAYRQAAQLGFEIEPLTQQALIKFSSGLKNVATERIRTELGYLLTLGTQGTRWITKAAHDQILSIWLPTKNLIIPRFALVDRAIAQVIDQFPELERYFTNILSSDRSVTVTVKLAALSASATALTPLGFSRLEQRWIVTLLRYLPQFMAYLDRSATKVSATEQYQLFTTTQEIFPALTVVAIASGQSLNVISPWLDRWLNPHDPIAHLVPILNGDDLKTELGLTAGAKIGDILDKLKLAQAEQIISNRQNAIAYAKTLI